MMACNKAKLLFDTQYIEAALLQRQRDEVWRSRHWTRKILDWFASKDVEKVDIPHIAKIQGMSDNGLD